MQKIGSDGSEMCWIAWMCVQLSMNVTTGLVIAANINTPGSWHDSHIAKPIHKRLLHSTPPGFYLVSDITFPQGTNAIAGQIKAPLKAGQSLSGSHQEIKQQMAFEHQLLSFCQTAKWGNHAIKSCFGHLCILLEIKHKQQQANILEICIQAHVLWTQRVELNQIQTIYKPNWHITGGDGNVILEWENLIFREQRTNDRVEMFHTVAVYDWIIFLLGF